MKYYYPAVFTPKGSVAKRNHTTVAALKKKNGLRGNTIRAGKKLRVK